MALFIGIAVKCTVTIDPRLMCKANAKERLKLIWPLPIPSRRFAARRPVLAVAVWTEGTDYRPSTKILSLKPSYKR